MIAQLRSELLKQRSTRAHLGLLSALLALVLLAGLLHGLGLPSNDVDSSSEQLDLVIGWGQRLSAVFAALLGALSLTNEIRYGTIRPTFVVTPDRTRVVAAKIAAALLFGAGFGLLATALAASVGSAALAIRGIENQIGVGDYALFLAGGTGAAALLAAVGVGIGAIVRSQIPTVIGICAWLLIVEGLLLGDLFGGRNIGRFAPGAAAAALSGQDPDTLLAPAAGLLLLVLYAAAACVAGSLVTLRRDVP